jgi:hypothetical protein
MANPCQAGDKAPSHRVVDFAIRTVERESRSKF